MTNDADTNEGSAQDRPHHHLPPRAGSRYAEQYAGVDDRARLEQILVESERIATESGDRATAWARYELALECAHQLVALGVDVEELGGRIAQLARVVGVEPVEDGARGGGAAAASGPAQMSAERPARRAGGPSEDELYAMLESIVDEVWGDGDSMSGTDAESEHATEERTDEQETEQSIEPTTAPTTESKDEHEPTQDLDPHLSVALTPLARVQPALADAGFHALPEVRLANDGEAWHRDLELRLRFEPAFARCEAIAISELGPGATLALPGDRVPVRLDRSFFAGLSERATGTVTAELVVRVEVDEVELGPPTDAHAPAGDTLHDDTLNDDTPHDDGSDAAASEPATALAERVLARGSCELELCPPGEWPGLAVPAEHLAAFVLPNEPGVGELLRAAADRLGEWTENPALDGYQSKDAARALSQAAAVYAAIQGSGVTYANPPASFAESGQRVRLPSDVADTKLATCLDLALLAAACLEQAGLHPLLLLFETHAACGVWLRPESFAEAVQTDARRVMKYVELGDIALFDPTAASSRPAIDFEAAQRVARDDTAGGRVLVAAIDLRRARRAGVRPLPTFGGRIAATPEGAGSEAIAVGAAPRLDALDELERLEAARQRIGEARRALETPDDRLERWRRQLLDLTMRNRLLAHRESKRTVPLFAPDVALLEDALARGERFRIEPRPSEVDALRRRGSEAGDTSREALAERLCELFGSELRENRLRADAGEQALANRLVTLYREARTATEEGGSSTLYLALGFLHFSEAGGTGATERRAPILLVPVELHRESASRGFALSLGADEVRVNVTLLEYLARDHGIEVTGLDPLPLETDTKEEGGDGVDVALALYTLRQAIRDKPHWRVSEEAALDLFSFAKILIWKDLADRRDDLLNSPVVRHLVETPNEAWRSDEGSGVAFPDPARLDDEVPATEVLCPMSYDSSQLAAIVAAARGKSFVLHGPPGTGKSQTITNLIAHLLGQGKRVLFVSEKRAALEVVRDRLERVGLGEACLELHSNKARKKDVLEQLRRALEAASDGDGAAWERAAGEYESERARLNAYVEALHAPRASGESLFDALVTLVSIEDRFEVTLPWSAVPATTPERLARARAAVEGLERTGRTVGPEHPLLAVGRTEYTLLWDRETRAVLDAWNERVDAAAGAGRAAREALGLDRDAPWSRAAWRAFATFLRVLDGAAVTVPRELLERADLGGLAARATTWGAAVRDVNDRRAALDARFSAPLASLGLEVLESTIAEARVAWFLPAWSKKRGVVRAVRSVAKEPARIDFDAAAKAVGEARALEAAEAALAAIDAEARADLGERWKGESTDLAELDAHVAFAAGYDAALEGLVEASGRSRDSLRAAAVRGLAAGELGAQARAFLESFDAFETATAELAGETRLALDARGLDVASGEDAFDADRARARRWRAAWGELPRWCAWRAARAEALAAELGFLVDALEAGRVLAPELSHAFERAFADQWFAEVASSEPVLAGFVGEQHDLVVERFRALDARVLDLATEALRARVLGRVAGAVVGGREAPESSEVGLLHRELRKKSRHLALRRLFEEIPGVLAQLKPCLLMSPLSVAQYLDPAGPRFDAVVFDEASQIAIWDAIGAMARGSQVIVVGDPKQLPPTNFFERGADEAEDEEVFVEDAESILDECLAARVPSLYLEWHYRSRHEGLIAFSNRRYYDGRLVTFPAREDDGLGVSLVRVDGVYDHGETRTNRVEAEAVVAEVERRLAAELARVEGSDGDSSGMRSIGVVTFNQPQQMLIEDLLDELRRRRPDLEVAFGEGVEEPVFVKNLENVQGDERDVILFSIGFGPDEHGKVRLNFGPLNRSGGERRLNVAITRARREAVVFTGLRPEHIDPARTKSEGARDLRLFLEYAERGPAAFEVAAVNGAAAAHERDRASSALVDEVAAALEARGWVVARRIGCSAYRIDLAVADAAAPERFLLGVECDGASYRDARTARDRDRLRVAVLEGLGWSVHRVWSTEWWRDREREVARIEAALERARGALAHDEDESEVAPDDADDAARVDGAELASESGDPGHDAGDGLVRDGWAAGGGAIATSFGSSRVAGGSGATDGLASVDGARDADAREGDAPGHGAAGGDGRGDDAGDDDGPGHDARSDDAPGEPYRVVRLRRSRRAPERFYDADTAPLVAAALGELVAGEAPIAFESAARRVAECFGVERLTERARTVVEEAVRAGGLHREDDHGTIVLWSGADAAATYASFRPAAEAVGRRAPRGGEPEREAEDLSTRELANAAAWSLATWGAMERRDLARETARLFGFARMGRRVEERVDAALDRLIAEGRALEDGASLRPVRD